MTTRKQSRTKCSLQNSPKSFSKNSTFFLIKPTLTVTRIPTLFIQKYTAGLLQIQRVSFVSNWTFILEILLNNMLTHHSALQRKNIEMRKKNNSFSIRTNYRISNQLSSEYGPSQWVLWISNFWTVILIRWVWQYHTSIVDIVGVLKRCKDTKTRINRD